MSKSYKPIIYQKDIFTIDYDKLKQNGASLLLFDIDNTIAETNVKKPNEKVISLFNNLKRKGFKIVILTNAVPWRAKRFAKILDVDVFYLSCKPASFNYKRILKKYHVFPSGLVAIGDQVCTDIKGANNAGIISVLVDPLSKKEGLLTKFNRIKENRLIKKENIIERGEYYG